MRVYRPEYEPKYPIALCVSNECWKSIVRWQKDHYGTALQPPPAPLPELEDLETIARLITQVPEESDYLKG